MGYGYELQQIPTELFRTLADPTRRAIYEQLVRNGEQNVRALTDHAGVSQPTVSKHLNLLKQVGLVQERPSGRTVHYTADPQGLAPLIDWMNVYGAYWHDQFNRLESVLDGMDK
jgi:DNA-binding transcriptional ArsR family regulator